MRKKLLTTLLFLLAASLFQGTAHAAEEVVTDTGTTSWMLTSTALVLLMIPFETIMKVFKALNAKVNFNVELLNQEVKLA